MTLPKLRIAREVTRAHGEKFADEWFRASLDTLAMVDVFAGTRLLMWPGEDDEAAQKRYEAIEAEILGLTFEAVKPAIAEAFVKVAAEVLDRERER